MSVIQYLPIGIAAAAFILRYVEGERTMPATRVDATKRHDLPQHTQAFASQG